MDLSESGDRHHQKPVQERFYDDGGALRLGAGEVEAGVEQTLEKSFAGHGINFMPDSCQKLRYNRILR